jgi:hypothetical protein
MNYYVTRCSVPEDWVHFLVIGSYLVQCTFSLPKTYFKASYNVCHKCLHSTQDIIWNTCAITWPKFCLVFYASLNITEKFGIFRQLLFWYLATAGDAAHYLQCHCLYAVSI